MTLTSLWCGVFSVNYQFCHYNDCYYRLSFGDKKSDGMAQSFYGDRRGWIRFSAGMGVKSAWTGGDGIKIQSLCTPLFSMGFFFCRWRKSVWLRNEVDGPWHRASRNTGKNMLFTTCLCVINSSCAELKSFRNVTKFEFDDVRILTTSGILDILIVWSFSVECEQSKNFPFIVQNGNWCGMCVSWFSAAHDISICYNLQIRRLDQWFSALQVLISKSWAGNFHMPVN